MLAVVGTSVAEGEELDATRVVEGSRTADTLDAAEEGENAD